MRWFIALRYFVSHRRQSLICIAGVTISVTMLLAMQSMMEGFTDKFIVETVESSGHITVHDDQRETHTEILEKVYRDPNALLKVEHVKPRSKVLKIKNPGGLIATLRRMHGILGVAPEVTGNLIGIYGTKTVTIQVLGVEPEQQVAVTTIGSKIIAGDFQRLKTSASGIILGSGLADNLGAKLDDTINVSSQSGGRSSARVVGIFQTGVTPVDYSRGYMLLNNVQTLLDKKNVVNEIIIRSDDYTRAGDYAAQIEAISGYRTESWQETNANFLKIFKIQTVITLVINAALLVVAAFGVLNILIMAVMERIGDIAILKSFGFSRRDITLIYLYQGILIGLIGATLGEIFGKLAIEGLRRLPIKMQGLIQVEGLLMSEHSRNYVGAFVAAMVIVMVAAAYPARRAAGYDPVEVIRGAH